MFFCFLALFVCMCVVKRVLGYMIFPPRFVSPRSFPFSPSFFFGWSHVYVCCCVSLSTYKPFSHRTVLLRVLRVLDGRYRNDLELIRLMLFSRVFFRHDIKNIFVDLVQLLWFILWLLVGLSVVSPHTQRKNWCENPEKREKYHQRKNSHPYGLRRGQMTFLVPCLEFVWHMLPPSMKAHKVCACVWVLNTLFVFDFRKDKGRIERQLCEHRAMIELISFHSFFPTIFFFFSSEWMNEWTNC